MILQLMMMKLSTNFLSSLLDNGVFIVLTLINCLKCISDLHFCEKKSFCSVLIHKSVCPIRVFKGFREVNPPSVLEASFFREFNIESFFAV